MISLFEKDPQGRVLPLAHGNQTLFPSLEDFQKTMGIAEQQHDFDQIIIVGTGNDIAWIHAALPGSVMCHIVAEIEYPLLPAWFKQSLPLSNFTRALESLFSV